MEKKDFYLLIDDICDLDEGTIKGDESLEESGLFDSLALLGLIAMLDKKFDQKLSTDEILKLGTVDDLFSQVSK